jgi:hypothetical protein
MESHGLTRRYMLSAGAALALSPGITAEAGAPRHRISAVQVRDAVAQRFPLRYPVGGLFDLAVQAPELRFMAASDRVGARAAVLAAGAALRRRYPGVLDIDFALRYEPADMTIRAHQLRVVSLQMTGLPPQAGALLDAYMPALTRQTWSDVVLHTLSAQDLSLPDTMGLRPDRITVQDDGLVVSFTAKAAQ